MAILHSMLRNAGDDLDRNRAAYESLRKEVESAQGPSVRGGGGKYAKTHIGRVKLLPLERINELLHPETPFLEVVLLAWLGLYEEVVLFSLQSSVIGMVNGQPCEVMTK